MMGRSSIPAALAELSQPTSPEAQVAALRNLKNEIVGHDQRKELAVQHGVVRPLADILRAETRKGAKRRRNNVNGSGSAARELERSTEWTIEDELRFQATLVVGSLANAGPAFVSPMLVGNVLHPLLESISPAEAPAKLVTATLRTLEQIADAVAQEKPWADASDGPLRPTLFHSVCEYIYTRAVVEGLADVLAQPAHSISVQQQISLATKLIAKTCREEWQRKLLLEIGVLDQLSTKLAAMAVVDAQALMGESRRASRDELPVIYLSDILDAIAVIIKDSHYNAARFCYSTPIQQLFGTGKESASASYGSSQTPWDKLVPRLQTIQNRSDAYSKSWPALGSAGTLGAADSYTRLPSIDFSQSSSRTVVTEECENPLFIWLIFAARRGDGRTRLSACWLLALLKKFNDKWPLNDPSKITRERHLAYLVVPLVVNMMEAVNPKNDATKDALLSLQARQERDYMLENSPLVLAELVGGNKTLQNAAVDTRIISLIVQTLKKSFEPVACTKQLWSPRNISPQVEDPSIDKSSSTLGSPGLGPEVLHAYRYRESSLLALAALADTQDTFRKQIIEAGAANLIIDSLVPYTEPGRESPSAMPSAQPLSSQMPPPSAKAGNPISVLIAACKVTRSLSRSISVLRTSLIDCGVAMPVFRLLEHGNVKVQIAATEVITNLVLEVSPMRMEIVEAGALKTLCEHCRSANFDLRFGSLWALKHLCLSLPSAAKIQCLDELGVGWLVQTLNGEPGKSAGSQALGMGTPNAAGEQVDILNAVDDPHMDVDDESSSEEDEDNMTDSIHTMRQHQRPGSRYTSATNIRDRLQTIKNDEQDQRLNSDRDDIRLQEQALDFIRNFINEDKASGEMIDHLLSSFGRTRFFELLDSKIRPKGVQSSSAQYWNNNTQQQHRPPFSSSANPNSSALSSPNWAAYPPTELIIGTMYILVHLANGRSAHRTLLVSQSPLMSHILPLFTHPRRDVRLPCAWFITNLTYVEETADEPASRERAQSLRQLGFEDGVRMLGRDPDLDIRERAKNAIEQLGKLLGEERRFEGGLGTGAGVGVGSGLGRLSALGAHRAWGRDSQ